jgi:cytochrome c-type biogenesis protein
VTDPLFDTLTRALEGGTLIALAAALVWGILSVVLSPCHLTSIPLVVGYISQQQLNSVKKAFWTSLVFSLGILFTIGLIGAVTTLLGRMMGDIGKWGNILVAVVLFLVGLYLLDILRFQLPGMGQFTFKKKGLLAAFIMGLIFGIALGPCTFAFMAPILAVTLYSSSSNLAFGILLLAAYGIGHCLVIVLAGSFMKMVQKYLKWNEQSKGIAIMKKICGVLIILGGFYILNI